MWLCGRRQRHRRLLSPLLLIPLRLPCPNSAVANVSGVVPVVRHATVDLLPIHVAISFSVLVIGGGGIGGGRGVPWQAESKRQNLPVRTSLSMLSSPKLPRACLEVPISSSSEKCRSVVDVIMEGD
jgi:hypothetical protein